jgi:hypothetical protein
VGESERPLPCKSVNAAGAVALRELREKAALSLSPASKPACLHFRNFGYDKHHASFGLNHFKTTLSHRRGEYSTGLKPLLAAGCHFTMKTASKFSMKNDIMYAFTLRSGQNFMVGVNH